MFCLPLACWSKVTMGSETNSADTDCCDSSELDLVCRSLPHYAPLWAPSLQL